MVRLNTLVIGPGVDGIFARVNKISDDVGKIKQRLFHYPDLEKDVKCLRDSINMLKGFSWIVIALSAIASILTIIDKIKK